MTVALLKRLLGASMICFAPLDHMPFDIGLLTNGAAHLAGVVFASGATQHEQDKDLVLVNWTGGIVHVPLDCWLKSRV
jgi:hypothetical protein